MYQLSNDALFSAPALEHVTYSQPPSASPDYSGALLSGPPDSARTVRRSPSHYAPCCLLYSARLSIHQPQREHSAPPLTTATSDPSQRSTIDKPTNLIHRTTWFKEGISLPAHIHHIYMHLSCSTVAAPPLPPLSSVEISDSPQTPPKAEPTNWIHRSTQFEQCISLAARFGHIRMRLSSNSPTTDACTGSVTTGPRVQPPKCNTRHCAPCGSSNTRPTQHVTHHTCTCTAPCYCIPGIGHGSVPNSATDSQPPSASPDYSRALPSGPPDSTRTVRRSPLHCAACCSLFLSSTQDILPMLRADRSPQQRAGVTTPGKKFNQFCHIAVCKRKLCA